MSSPYEAAAEIRDIIAVLADQLEAVLPSLRDHFALHAPPMPDAWASIRRLDVPVEEEPEQDLRLLCEWRYAYADQMLRTRNAAR